MENRVENADVSALDDSTRQFIEETAGALVYAYRLDDAQTWVWGLGNGEENSAQEVMENWIRRYVRWVPKRLYAPMFCLLHAEFEQLYYEREGCRELGI